MFNVRFVLLFSLLILVSSLPSNSHLPFGRTFALSVGEVITIGEDLQIGFDGVPSDNRCPEGVFCIWEGDAVAKMWADQPSSERAAFELHTHRSFQWQFTYGDYRITLVSVVPYPKIDERTDPNNYIATILVADVATPVENSSWGRIKALYE
jgi:hypothetical protein